jgi:hypothetical protein
MFNGSCQYLKIIFCGNNRDDDHREVNVSALKSGNFSGIGVKRDVYITHCRQSQYYYHYMRRKNGLKVQKST